MTAAATTLPRTLSAVGGLESLKKPTIAPEIAGKLVAFGEVGLAGEVRPAPRGQDRLKEAAKLGFERAIVPHGNLPKGKIGGLEVIAVERVDQAVAHLRNG